MRDMTFDQFIAQAERAHFEGWDFSYLSDRWRAEPLPWDYQDYCRVAVRKATCLLDIGTGGGEFLASLGPLPARTFATEAHSPNVEIARKRLGPLTVQVTDMTKDPLHNHLPFPDGYFDLITDRHTGASATELWRCLRNEGSYITEQVGDQDALALKEWLGAARCKDGPLFNLSAVTEHLTQIGFKVVAANEAYPKCVYKDVGAVVYHLKAVPWMVPDFSVTRYEAQLLALHEHITKFGGFTVSRHRFFVHVRNGVG